MQNVDGLRFNLVKKYRGYNLPSEVIDNAIEYALNNSKKEHMTYITCASKYIELFILTEAKNNNDYKKILEKVYDSEVSLFSMRNKVPISKVEESKEEIIDKILKKSIYKNEDSISMVIRKHMEKSLIKYQLEGKRKNIGVEQSEKKIVKFDENMHFLKSYYSITELSNITGISIYELSSCLLHGSYLSTKIKNKILESFQVSNAEKLYEKLTSEQMPKLKHEKKTETSNKTKNSDSIIKKERKTTVSKRVYNNEKNYNISFLKEYFEKTNYSKKDFAKNMNVSVKKVDEWFNGDFFRERYLERLLSYFKVENLPELINKVRKELNDILIAQLKEENEKIKKERKIHMYDISFFKEYINSKHITKTLLCNILNMSYTTVNKMILGNRLLNTEKLELLLKYFNVSNYDELKIKIINESKQVMIKNKKISEKKIYDVSFINKTKCMSKKFLGNLLHLSHMTISKVLSGERLLKYSELELLLKYFNKENYEELKLFFENMNEKDFKILKSKIFNEQNNRIYDISFFNNYIKSKNITKLKLVDILKVSTTSLDKMLLGEKLLNDKELELLLKYFNKVDYEELKEYIKECGWTKLANKEEEKLYSLRFLETYLYNNNILLKQFSDIIGIRLEDLHNYIKNGKLVNENTLKLFLNYFEVSNYEELKEKVSSITPISTRGLTLKFDGISPSRERSNFCDISFLKKYIKNKKIKNQDLAAYLKVSPQYLSNCLNGRCVFNTKHINKLCDFFKVENFEELKIVVKKYENSIEKNKVIVQKENHNNKDNYNENEDLTLLKEYLKVKEISQKEISKVIDMSENNFWMCLNNKRKLSNKKLNIILKYLGFETYDDLKIELNKLNASFENKDLNLLREYLKVKGIPQSEIAKVINMSSGNFCSCLSNKKNLSYERLAKILEYLGLETYDDLKNPGKKIDNYDRIRDENNLYIEYINKYISKYNISYCLISKKTGKSWTTIQNWLEKRVKVNKDKINILLTALGFDNIDDLIKKVQNEQESEQKIEEDPILEKQDTKNNSLNSNSNRFEKKLESSNNKQKFDKLKVNTAINNEILFDLLKEYKLTETEYKAILLLFGAKDGKYYSIEEVKNIIGISASDVLRIYKNCLTLYKNALNDNVESELEIVNKKVYELINN